MWNNYHKIEEAARFSDYVRRIFRSIVDIERTIVLSDEIPKIITGEGSEGDRILIIGFGEN